MKSTRILTTLKAVFFCFLLCAHVSAQDWVDVTDVYITNPRFENNDKTGWTLYGSWWYGGYNTSYNAMEMWYAYFRVGQELTDIPNGKYRLSVNGYYRPGNFDQNAIREYDETTAQRDAYMFADDTEQKIKSVYSEYATYYTNGDSYYRDGQNFRFYPNTMEGASARFVTGGYLNTMEFEVEDGSVMIGMACDPNEYGDRILYNWTIWTGWKLEYYTTMQYVTSIVLSQNSMSVDKGSTTLLTATVLPVDATIPKLNWSSSDEGVATVDKNGFVYAVDNGTCVITASSTDGSNVTAQCSVRVTSTPASADNLIITEVQTRNVDMFIDPSYNYGGWIEIYNTSGSVVDLGRVIVCDALRGYEMRLPNDYGTLPANSYGLIWFDHYDGQYGKNAYKQVDWKLDTDGGAVTIKAQDGAIIATQSFPSLVGRTSYARKTDATGNYTTQWGITAQPTPGADNNTSVFATTQMSMPEVDAESGLFTSPFTFSVTYPTDATLVYTTDGSTPTLINGEQSTGGSMSEQVDATAIYRFRLFKEGMIPSEVVTRSWIYNDREYELPLVIVNTAPENLYDGEIGIYTRGWNGRSGNGVTGTNKANWNMDWERPVNFEYIDENKDINFSQEVDMSISGGWSRMWGMTYCNLLSFKLKATKTYGLNSLDNVWFDAKPYNKYKHLMVRNGGNDLYSRSRCKDNMLQQIIMRSGIYVDAQEASAAHVFLNGEFKGTMNIREATNKQYGYSNYGLDTDLQDAFEMSVDSGYVQMVGDREAFEEWYEESATAYTQGSWDRIKELVDIDEFTNYFALQLYMNNWDWPHNNLKAFRDKADGGRFHFVIFDLDNCYDRSFNPFTDFENQRYYTFYTIYREDGSSYNIREEVELVTIFLNMLQNEEFKKKFIDTYCLVAGSVFEPVRCAEIVEEIRSKMYRYMSMEGYQNYVNSHAAILTNNLTSSMQNTQVSYMANYLSLTNSLTASLKSNISNAGIMLNDMTVPTGKFSGRLYYPITVKAVAPSGYRFVGWQGIGSNPLTKDLFTMNSIWQYYDQGDLTGTDWKTTGEDVDWSTGEGLFGFNSRNDGADIHTTIDAGPGPGKRPTYYFRKSLVLDDAPGSSDVFTMTVNFDDGYIIYVNGVEVARKRLNSGAGYNDYASAYGSDPYDTDNFTIAASNFVQGENVIAVEVHNQSLNSSDIYFDASLTQRTTEAVGEIVCNDVTYSLSAGESYDLTAVWEEMSESEKEAEGLSVAPIVINEVSAANSIYINDFYKKDDWVELYNTTDEDIDLEGLYITDRRDNPAKWMITNTTKNDASVRTKASTIIPAHGYKIIWCGDRYKKVTEASTELHSNFNLSNSPTEERYVAIGKYDTSMQRYDWADSLAYKVMNGDQTIGRYPDAAEDRYLMTLPTINKQNTLTMYAEAFSMDDETSIQSLAADNDVVGSEGGLSIRYFRGTLYVNCEESDVVSVAIYNMNGALLSRQDISVSDGHATISVSGLGEGLYVARATADGKECGTKFLK